MQEELCPLPAHSPFDVVGDLVRQLEPICGWVWTGTVPMDWTFGWVGCGFVLSPGYSCSQPVEHMGSWTFGPGGFPTPHFTTHFPTACTLPLTTSLPTFHNLLHLLPPHCLHYSPASFPLSHPIPSPPHLPLLSTTLAPPRLFTATLPPPLSACPYSRTTPLLPTLRTPCTFASHLLYLLSTCGL